MFDKWFDKLFNKIWNSISGNQQKYKDAIPLALFVAIFLLFLLIALPANRSQNTSELPSFNSPYIPDNFNEEVVKTLESGGEINMTLCEGGFAKCEKLFKELHEIVLEEINYPSKIRMVETKKPGDIGSIYANWESGEFNLTISFHFITNEKDETNTWVEVKVNQERLKGRIY